MNAKAYDIYQELITLPDSKLAEVQQFIEFVKFKKYYASQTDKDNQAKELAWQRTEQRMQRGYHLGGQMPSRDSLYEH